MCSRFCPMDYWAHTCLQPVPFGLFMCAVSRGNANLPIRWAMWAPWTDLSKEVWTIQNSWKMQISVCCFLSLTCWVCQSGFSDVAVKSLAWLIYEYNLIWRVFCDFFSCKSRLSRCRPCSTEHSHHFKGPWCRVSFRVWICTSRSLLERVGASQDGLQGSQPGLIENLAPNSHKLCLILNSGAVFGTYRSAGACLQICRKLRI